MRRELLMLVMVMVMTWGCGGCSGANVVTDPGVDPTPVEVDGGAVAEGTVVEVLDSYATVAADDTLTIGEVVIVAFKGARGGVLAADAMDNPVGRNGLTVGGVLDLSEPLIRGGLKTAGLWDFVLFDPSSPHVELGNHLALAAAKELVAMFGNSTVTVGELIGLPVVLVRVALEETGAWTKEVDKIHPTAPTRTVGEIYEGAVEMGRAAVILAGAWNIVVFTTKDPGAVEDRLREVVPGFAEASDGERIYVAALEAYTEVYAMGYRHEVAAGAAGGAAVVQAICLWR